MLRMAETWFMDYPFLEPHQQRLVDAILQAHFGSSAAEVRRTVHGRIIAMAGTMDAAMSAGVTFDCTSASKEKCAEHPWSMYVTRGERNIIHACPDFFTAGLESRRFTLIHESAHMAGVGDRSYLLTAGPIGLGECLAPSRLATAVALDNADSYTWAVFCLTREPGFTIIPAADVQLKKP
jgi:hypothetical protein